MNKILLVFFTSILLISSVSAVTICIDHDAPLPPSNLAVTSSGQNIILTWPEATDEPSCGGVDYYNVSRDGNPIGTTPFDTLTYTDENVPYGTYSYTVYAVDKVGHNSGLAIKNDVVLSAPSSGGGSTTVGGGGGGSSHICYEEWQCGDWGECINERQTRTCEDLKLCGTIINKPTEFRVCNTEEIKEPILTKPTQTSSFRNLLTGAVTGVTEFVKSKKGIGLGFILVILVLGGIVFIVQKRSKLNEI